ncbi:LOW QUALITY PROTEIN: hypothetical protein PHMEG_0008354 [Phytophthora megakarya]|uniref:Uncharacterized protein n=1 Tax=Phytophthora megakarya TaxID=4795 RepID=A0A225WJU6_9STRA|nr:LOW QUALITY PROTEIN: hypothetical protein PHMEG_0008354 [Phytophthora megakarya]
MENHVLDGGPNFVSRAGFTALRGRTEMHRITARHLTVNLQASEVAKAIKGTAITANVPAINYSMHSIRIGGTTALMSGGVDRLTINLL